MPRAITAWVCLGLWAALGCGGSLRAPLTPEGQPYTMSLLIDPGITADFNPEQVEQRHQLSSYMQSHLVELLGRLGYAVAVLQHPSQFTAQPGHYLLSIRIARYNPGSTAARVLVGFGAGACSLDTAYAVVGPGGQPVHTGAQSKGSGRSWEALVRGVNELTVREVTQALHQAP